MASITVRNLDEGLKRRLRIRAAENGRSMEQEGREILGDALGEDPSVPPEEPPRTGADLAAGIMALFAPIHAEFGDVELELPPRDPVREPPRFD
ncbi:MAG: plasmid stabilization protein [Chloroflexi bacterium]|nr:plasmid stabilization protein [Chloroflexota bacterium]